MKKILMWLYLKFHSLMIMISIALRNTELEILKADPDDLDESKKHNIRQRHHNKLLERFYAGQTDKKYVREYYELLKKADKFMLNSSKFKMAVSADKNGMNLGKEHIDGRKYDHIGFFSDGHRHEGKTLGEAIDIELKERRTTDDDYEIIAIYDNKPIEVPLSKLDDLVDQTYNTNIHSKKSKSLSFPFKIQREDENILNKIEHLTSHLHVKKIGFEHRQLEFFIPKKFKVGDLDEKSKIFNELIKINSLYLKNKYGELIGFNIKDYFKKIEIEDYVVLKFNAIEIKNMENE